MKKTIGIWIDHENAYIVRPEHADAAVERLKSDISQQDKTGQSEGVKNELHAFYSKVKDGLQDAEELFLVGPGTAKDEFRELLTSSEKHQHVAVTMDSAQHVSEPQLKDLVMTHFGHSAKRHLRNIPGQPAH